MINNPRINQCCHIAENRCKLCVPSVCSPGGYWLGGRPSAAVPRESARKRADSARFRADPANFRQKYFPAESAERPSNVRRTPPDSARKRANPRGVRRELAEEFTRKMSADKNLSYATVPGGRSSVPDDPPPRTIPPRMCPTVRPGCIALDYIRCC